MLDALQCGACQGAIAVSGYLPDEGAWSDHGQLVSVGQPTLGNCQVATGKEKPVAGEIIGLQRTVGSRAAAFLVMDQALRFKP